MDIQAIVGIMATIIGTSLMLPQLYKSYTSKSLADISWGMLVLYFLNCLLWLVYGLILFDLALMAANGIALVISILQIMLKISYSAHHSE